MKPSFLADWKKSWCKDVLLSVRAVWEPLLEFLGVCMEGIFDNFLNANLGKFLDDVLEVLLFVFLCIIM